MILLSYDGKRSPIDIRILNRSLVVILPEGVINKVRPTALYAVPTNVSAAHNKVSTFDELRLYISIMKNPTYPGRVPEHFAL
jgi:hypothetical protein